MRKPARRGRIGKFLRFFAGAAISALVLCACTDSTPPRGTKVTTVSGTADTVLPKRVVLSTGFSAPEYLLAAAEKFCQNSNAISSGVFTVSLKKSADPLADFNDGKADIVLLDGESAKSLHPFFAIAGEPFLYGSYEKFSVTLNSAQVLQRLSRASGATAFAAYYTGSGVFAGYAALDEALDPGREEDRQTESRKIELAVTADSGARLRRYFPDVTVLSYTPPSQRVEVLAENTLAELPVELETMEALCSLIPDAGASESQGLVVTRSFHDISAAWLIIEPSLYENLPPLGRAALLESAALMTGDIDGVCLQRETELFDMLENEGIEISGAFTATRSRILRAESERFPGLPKEEREFRELLLKFR